MWPLSTGNIALLIHPSTSVSPAKMGILNHLHRSSSCSTCISLAKPLPISSCIFSNSNLMYNITHFALALSQTTHIAAPTPLHCVGLIWIHVDWTRGLVCITIGPTEDPLKNLHRLPQSVFLVFTIPRSFLSFSRNMSSFFLHVAHPGFETPLQKLQPYLHCCVHHERNRTLKIQEL